MVFPLTFLCSLIHLSYYINYLTKAMQLEDPRVRYRQLQNEHASTESIPTQTSLQVLANYDFFKSNVQFSRVFFYWYMVNVVVIPVEL